MRDVLVAFAEDVAEHELTVRRDDGLYRHLRFQKPGTWIYGFDLITWPGVGRAEVPSERLELVV